MMEEYRELEVEVPPRGRKDIQRGLLLFALFVSVFSIGLTGNIAVARVDSQPDKILGALSAACSIFTDATTCAKQLGFADPRQFGGFCDSVTNNNTHDDTAALVAAAATGMPVMIPYPACKMASKLTIVRDGTKFFAPGAGLAYNSDLPVQPYIWVPNNIAANRASTGNCVIDYSGYDGTTFENVDFRANYALEGTVAICNGYTSTSGIRSPRGASFINLQNVSFLNISVGIGSAMTSAEDLGATNACTPTGTLGNQVLQVRANHVNFIGMCMGIYGNISDAHITDYYGANVRHNVFGGLAGFGSGWHLGQGRIEYSGFGGGDGTVYNHGAGIFFDGPHGASITGLDCDHEYGPCVATGPSAKRVYVQAHSIDAWYTNDADVDYHTHYLIDGSDSVVMDISAEKNAVNTPYVVQMVGTPDNITIRGASNAAAGVGGYSTSYWSLANVPAHFSYCVPGLGCGTVGTNYGIGNSAPGALLDLGLAGTTAGVIRLEGSTSGYTQIAAAATAGSWQLTTPSTDGAAGDLLQNIAGTGTTTWATPQAVTDLTAASTVDANTLFPCRENGETTDNKCTGTQVKAYTTTTANQLTTDAAGTVYSLTATPAAVDFGTTDPVITVSAAGTYLVVADCVLRLNGATFAADRTVTMKLRRTNNTAADLTGATRAYDTGAVSGLTATLAHFNVSAIYTTANANDSVTIFGDVSVVPTVGSLDVNSCSIRATRLQQ